MNEPCIAITFSRARSYLHYCTDAKVGQFYVFLRAIQQDINAYKSKHNKHFSQQASAPCRVAREATREGTRERAAKPPSLSGLLISCKYSHFTPHPPVVTPPPFLLRETNAQAQKFFTLTSNISMYYVVRVKKVNRT